METTAPCNNLRYQRLILAMPVGDLPPETLAADAPGSAKTSHVDKRRALPARSFSSGAPGFLAAPEQLRKGGQAFVRIALPERLSVPS